MNNSLKNCNQVLQHEVESLKESHQDNIDQTTSTFNIFIDNLNKEMAFVKQDN